MTPTPDSPASPRAEVVQSVQLRTPLDPRGEVRAVSVGGGLPAFAIEKKFPGASLRVDCDSNVVTEELRWLDSRNFQVFKKRVWAPGTCEILISGLPVQLTRKTSFDSFISTLKFPGFRQGCLLTAHVTGSFPTSFEISRSLPSDITVAALLSFSNEADAYAAWCSGRLHAYGVDLDVTCDPSGSCLVNLIGGEIFKSLPTLTAPLSPATPSNEVQDVSKFGGGLARKSKTLSVVSARFVIRMNSSDCIDDLKGAHSLVNGTAVTTARFMRSQTRDSCLAYPSVFVKIGRKELTISMVHTGGTVLIETMAPGDEDYPIHAPLLSLAELANPN